MLQAQIYLDKNDFHHGRALYKVVLEKLQALHIAGATVLEGITGFGASGHIKDPQAPFSFDEPPIVLIFTDEDEKVKAALTALRQETTEGFIVTLSVEKW